jgi:hypothetical protein
MRRGVPWSDAGNVCCPSPDPAKVCSLMLLSASGCSSKAAPPVVGSSLRFARLPLAPCSPVDPLPGVPEPRLWATAMHKSVLPLKDCCTTPAPPQGINTSMYTCQTLRLTIAYACTRCNTWSAFCLASGPEDDSACSEKASSSGPAEGDFEDDSAIRGSCPHEFLSLGSLRKPLHLHLISATQQPPCPTFRGRHTHQRSPWPTFIVPLG